MAEGGGDLKLPRVKPEFEGFLTKRSTWLKDWRSRYFRLIGNKLYFSKDTTVRRRRRRVALTRAAKELAPLRPRACARPRPPLPRSHHRRPPPRRTSRTA